MNLFSEAQLPKLKQPDGFTPLQNGLSYNGLVDEQAELILRYNDLLKMVHESKNQKGNAESGAVRSSKSFDWVITHFKLFREGLSYRKLIKEYDGLAANFNHLVAENYELTQEIQRLKATVKS